jgi:predicted nucleic acid-binding protein
MTTWIDTNVLAALWNANVDTQKAARTALREAAESGWFAISGCVYAELVAGPDRTPEMVNAFLEETEIPVSWQTGEDVWRLTAERFRAYAEMRRTNSKRPKRLLADFLIGAQASLRGGRLLTFDERNYAAAYPELTLLGRSHGTPG